MAVDEVWKELHMAQQLLSRIEMELAHIDHMLSYSLF
jgi:hypothetical protein